MSLFKPNTPKLFCDGIQTLGDSNTWRLYADGIYTGDVNRVTLTTTRNGLFTATITGTNGTSLWFDWGEGGALEEFPMTGGAVACTNTYGDASSKTIAITGDVDAVTVFICTTQSLTGADLSKFANLTNLSVLNNASLSFDVATLSAMSSLASLNIGGTAAFGSMSSIDDLSASMSYINISGTLLTGSVASLAKYTAATNLRTYNTPIGGNISDLNPLTNLTILYAFNSNLGVTNSALPAWAGCAIRAEDCEWSTQEVDWFLTNMADGVGAGGNIRIDGSNGIRTQPDTDAAVAAIVGAGRTLTVNE